mgnify:CR=1 FL=1
MNNYFVLQDKSVLPLIGAVSYSTGDGLELSQRYGYDYSKKPQSLTHRKRNTALTATVQTSFNPVLCSENDVMMMDYISDLEHVCGQKVDFYWNKKAIGSFVIQSVQFSGATDAVQILSGMAVSFSMTEGYVRRENLETAVRY